VDMPVPKLPVRQLKLDRYAHEATRCEDSTPRLTRMLTYAHVCSTGTGSLVCSLSRRARTCMRRLSASRIASRRASCTTRRTTSVLRRESSTSSMAACLFPATRRCCLALN
jgi:hypothetical protein